MNKFGMKAIETELINLLSENLGPLYTIEFEDVCSINKKYRGVKIRNNGNDSGFLINISDALNAIDNTEGLVKLSERIVRDVKNSEKEDGELLDEFSNGSLDKGSVLNSVYFALVNYERNKEVLERYEYDRFLDLAIVFGFHVNLNGKDGNIWIPKGYYGLTKEELKAAAERNTEKYFDYKTRRIDSFIDVQGMVGGQVGDDEIGLYVLNSDRFSYSASVMLYNKYFDALAEKFGGNVVVLPSSVHEVIAHASNGFDPVYEKGMVRTINENEVDYSDYLSDNVYIYLKDERMFVIA